MAKPLNNIPEWADASNGGNYTTGPYAGMPRKIDIPAAIAHEGFRPGAAHPTAAEHINSWLNKASVWITWVFDGKDTPDATAHLVETNATGRLAAQWAQFYASDVAVGATLSSQAPTASGNALQLYAEAPNTNALITATHDNNGSCLLFEGGAGLELLCHGANNDAIRVTTDGDGARGLEVYTTGDGADGVRVSVKGNAVNGLYADVDNTLAFAVTAIALQNGTGGRFIGGIASGQGLTAEGKAAEGISCAGGTGPTVPALRATGKLNAPGILGQGGPGGADGVVGLATGNGTNGLRGEGATRGVLGQETSGNGTGVRGATAPNATLNARGVLGVATGLGTAGGFVSVNGAAVAADATAGVGVAVLATSSNGNAVNATSGAGVAGYFESNSSNGIVTRSSSGIQAALDAGHFDNGHAAQFTTTGTRSTVRIVPRNTNPSVFSAGGLWHRQAQGFLAHITRNGIDSTRRLFDTAGGMAFGAAYDPSGDSVDEVTTEILSAELAGANAPTNAGLVLVRLHIEVGRVAGAPDVIVDISDDGVPASIPGFPRTVKLQESAGDYERHLAYEVPYTVPGAGDRTFKVTLASTTTDEIKYRNASIVVVGTF